VRINAVRDALFLEEEEEEEEEEEQEAGQVLESGGRNGREHAVPTE
jgi:hypothetical protein